MANTADIRSIQTDVTDISNASWNWHALTSDAKIVNRTCYGLVLQWLPKSIIPSWFKRVISNADVDKAYDNVKNKIITLLAHAETLQATDDKAKAQAKANLQSICNRATEKMNALIDKISKSRKEPAKNPHLDMNAMMIEAQAKAATKPATETASDTTPAGNKADPLVSPPGKNKRSPKSATPDQKKPESASGTPNQPIPPRTANLSTPHPKRDADLAELLGEPTPSTTTTPKKRRSDKWAALPERVQPRRASAGKPLTPLIKEGKNQKKSGK